jgi:hypothetical protein
LQAVVSTPGRRGLRDAQDSCLKFGVVTDAVCNDPDRSDATAGSDPEVPRGEAETISSVPDENQIVGYSRRDARFTLPDFVDGAGTASAVPSS